MHEIQSDMHFLVLVPYHKVYYFHKICESIPE